MKQIFPFLFALFLLNSIGPVLGQNLVFQPANPIPGEKVSIKYNPIGTDLERVEKIEAVCYEMSEKGIVATDVYLQQKEGGYLGAISISKDALVVFISLEAKERKDNYNGIGYSLLVYQNDRNTPQPGAFATLASAYGELYRQISIERDYEIALTYLTKEYSLNPYLKKEGKYLKNYSLYGAKAKNELVIAECQELIKTLRMTAKSEEDMQLMSSIHTNLGEKEEANAINETILVEYPDGIFAQNNLITSFFRAQSFEDKLEIYKTIQTKYSGSETVAASKDRISGTLATEYGKLNDWENCNKYFASMKDPVSKASFLNSLAWKMSGESIDAKPEQAAKGKEFSKQSLDLLQTEISSGSNKPVENTKTQWKEQLEYSYAMYSDTYALCTYHTGNFEEALQFQTIACEANHFADGEMSERYCIYMEKSKGAEAVEKELQKLISMGVATANMKDQYKRLYFENNALEKAFEKNMAFLNSLADDKKMKNLKEKMILDKAPDFALVNLEGEKVKLSDLKGKVVVLDFWATWCGPCITSFPGMQDAVEKYRDNDEVVFLFIDTWENGDFKSITAQRFIEENGYTFKVLMDNDNEVVAKYKVPGIPTKFVVDKNGNIRFKSIGFSGNNDDLLNEISMMIEMANEASSEIKTMP